MLYASLSIDDVAEAVATARQEIAFAHLQEWRVGCDYTFWVSVWRVGLSVTQ